MEHQNILNLFKKSSDSKLVTKTWNFVSELIYSTETLKSNLCDYNDAYILVKGKITIIGHNVTQAAFEN